MAIYSCTCCRTPPLHSHGRRCAVHIGGPVVPLPPPLGAPGGQDCTGPIVKDAIIAAYREIGGIALELALKAYE